MNLRAVAASLLLLVVAARADTRRIAIVVGNNAGVGSLPPLRYAEADAGKFAETLAQIGDVGAPDLFLLQGRDLAALQGVLTIAGGRVDTLHRVPDNQVVVIFYFSGHSDGSSLEIGRERLSFSDLRRWLSSTKADVRLAIVDSCKSGGLLGQKGGQPGPAFQIRLTDEMHSRGEVLLTSSASDEAALESTEIRGSYFTHHLVSGMRGAADRSGDGRVTLTEAYEYAYAHTVSTTAETLVGPQHPTYDYRLAGEGEFILSVLSRQSAQLVLPTGFDRVIVVHPLRDRVIAELPAGAARTIAVEPGEYAIRAQVGARVFAARVRVADGESRAVNAGDLRETSSSIVAPKGELVLDGQRHARVMLSIGAGPRGSVADGVAALASVAASVAAPTASGWIVALDVSAAHGPGFTETDVLALGGYRFGIDLGRLRFQAGAALTGGVITQQVDGGALFSSGALGAAVMGGGSVVVWGPVRAALDGIVPLLWMQRNGSYGPVLLPAAWLGLQVAL